MSYVSLCHILMCMFHTRACVLFAVCCAYASVCVMCTKTNTADSFVFIVSTPNQTTHRGVSMLLTCSRYAECTSFYIWTHALCDNCVMLWRLLTQTHTYACFKHWQLLLPLIWVLVVLLLLTPRSGCNTRNAGGTVVICTWTFGQIVRR
jgi:hypothetical protein